MTVIHEVEVLVTGFGPYPDGHGGQIDPNTSYTLTQMMPPVLEPRTAQNPSATRIRIVRPRIGYVPSEYRAIRQFCHDLHRDHHLQHDHHEGCGKDDDGNEKTLLVVHLGEARGLWDHHVTVERSAFKQGMTTDFWEVVGVPRNLKYYAMPDAVGETVDDLGPCPWAAEVPVGLQTAVDVDAVVEKARGVLKTCSQFSSFHQVYCSGNNKNAYGGGKQETDDDCDGKEDGDNKPLEIRPHMEAGFYACGFLYYESLANCYVRGRRSDVLFCHVPGKEDARSLGRARDAVLAVIVAAVDEVLSRRD